jgi:hypothetical protein
VIVKILQVSLNYEERLLIVMEVEIWHESCSVLNNLIIAGTSVRRWGVLDCREVQFMMGEGVSQ